jgi:hypothetical protein
VTNVKIGHIVWVSISILHGVTAFGDPFADIEQPKHPAILPVAISDDFPFAAAERLALLGHGSVSKADGLMNSISWDFGDVLAVAENGGEFGSRVTVSLKRSDGGESLKLEKAGNDIVRLSNNKWLLVSSDVHLNELTAEIVLIERRREAWTTKAVLMSLWGIPIPVCRVKKSSEVASGDGAVCFAITNEEGIVALVVLDSEGTVSLLSSKYMTLDPRVEIRAVLNSYLNPR